MAGDRPGPPKMDYTGRRFGMLVAIKKTSEGSSARTGDFYLFKCDCGNEKEIAIKNVARKTQRTVSCGCQQGRRPGYGWKGFKPELEKRDAR